MLFVIFKVCYIKKTGKCFKNNIKHKHNQDGWDKIMNEAKWLKGNEAQKPAAVW